jgi:methylated-DNA-[protein]-cysteine S-methyltransferase
MVERDRPHGKALHASRASPRLQRSAARGCSTRMNATTAALVPLPTVLGTFEAGLTERGVCCLSFPNESGAAARWLARRLPGVAVRAGDPRASRLAAELDAYLRGELREFSVPLDLAGTPFQRDVWRQLRAIPYGEVRSYADVARAIGRAAAVRAVGAANGANPVPVIVPCHRVIGSTGALTGFGAGIDWKLRLLGIEDPARWAELPLEAGPRGPGRPRPPADLRRGRRGEPRANPGRSAH